MSQTELPGGSSQAHFPRCPRCRKVNEPSSAYCYSCGLPLDETAKPTEYHDPIITQNPQPAHTAEFAGFWIRLAATLLDGVILFILTLVLVGVLPGVSVSEYLGNFSLETDTEKTTPIWFELADLALNTTYYTVLVWIWAGTIGKHAFGLYIVRSDGSRVGFGRALARCICYVISFLTLGIGFLMIAFRRDKRGLHDIICNTVVIRR